LKEIPFNPVSTQSLSRQIADQIRNAILDGSLQANDRLPTEDELAQRFNVSRPTIREALKRLAAQNLVRSKRGPTGGTFIQKPDLIALSESLASTTTLLVGFESFSGDEITQTRLEMEQVCARLAAKHRQDDDIKQLEVTLAEQADSSMNAESLCSSDVRFHRQIANATGNKMMSYLMSSVIEALQPAANLAAFRHRSHTIIYDQHRRLLDAIINKNETEAVSVMTEQVNYMAEQLSDAKESYKRSSQS
jgi:GntR family transcriptional repressor for pyruvate dehydrogenase complex